MSALIAAGLGDLLAGLVLGLLLGLVLSPILRSWIAWREYAQARRDAGAADRVVHHLEAEFETRRGDSIGAARAP